MPFKEERPGVSTTVGTYNDVLRDQYNQSVVVNQYLSHIGGTPQQPSSLPNTTLHYLHKHVLPPPPELMIGRDEEKTDVVDTLLQKSLARVAILGGGGMGKTTLALSILHEDAISKKYPSRYFVSCEGVLSVSSLIEEIANALRVPLDKRDAFLLDTIFSTFPDATLLCLDNFETLWDDEAIRPQIEAFLSLLQHRVLGLIITMRGAQRPLKVSWSQPVPLPLHPLANHISRRIFEEMTKGSVDEFVGKLLTAVDGIPLAISLISALLQEKHETSESLWSRWKTQSGVLKHGGKHRLSNLDTSIYLSVHGPRMREDPTTIDILSMLSVLPDGLPHNEEVIKELQYHLPKAYDLRNALLTLQHVSLVQVVQDEAAGRQRLRMLSPIQSFCQRTLEGSDELKNSITSFYVQMLCRSEDGVDVRGMAGREIHNIHAVLVRAWRRGKGDATIVTASIRFSSLTNIFSRNLAEEVLCAAIEGLVDEPHLQGRCHRELGGVQVYQCHLDAAGASFRCAIELHQQTCSVDEEAIDLLGLTRVYIILGELDKAEAAIKSSIKLAQQVLSVPDEGKGFHELGMVQRAQSKLEEAEESFKHAVELYKQVHDDFQEMTVLVMLGEAQMRQFKLDEAKASFKRANELGADVRSEQFSIRKQMFLQRFFIPAVIFLLLWTFCYIVIYII